MGTWQVMPDVLMPTFRPVSDVGTLIISWGKNLVWFFHISGCIFL